MDVILPEGHVEGTDLLVSNVHGVEKKKKPSHVERMNMFDEHAVKRRYQAKQNREGAAQTANEIANLLMTDIALD